MGNTRECYQRVDCEVLAFTSGLHLGQSMVQAMSEDFMIRHDTKKGYELGGQDAASQDSDRGQCVGQRADELAVLDEHGGVT